MFTVVNRKCLYIKTCIYIFTILNIVTYGRATRTVRLGVRISRLKAGGDRNYVLDCYSFHSCDAAQSGRAFTLYIRTCKRTRKKTKLERDSGI